MITDQQVVKFVHDMQQLTKQAVKQSLKERRNMRLSGFVSDISMSQRTTRHVLRKAIALFEQTFGVKPTSEAVKHALRHNHINCGFRVDTNSFDNKQLLAILGKQPSVMRVYVSSYNVGWY